MEKNKLQKAKEKFLKPIFIPFKGTTMCWKIQICSFLREMDKKEQFNVEKKNNLTKLNITL